MKEETKKAGLKLNVQKTKIMASSPITSWQIDGENMETVTVFIFLPSKITEDCDSSHEIKRCLLLGRKAMTNLNSILKGKDITLLTKGQYNERYYFPHSHVQMWELDHKEGWTLKNWCLQIVVLEKTLEHPLDHKGIKQVSPKGNQPWIFIGRTHAEAEAPILWPLDVNSRLIGKDPDAGKDWRQEKRMTEVGMVGWHCRIQRTWVWANCGRWWKTEKPGLLQSMGSQRVGHDWATELNWNIVSCDSVTASPLSGVRP